MNSFRRARFGFDTDNSPVEIRPTMRRLANEQNSGSQIPRRKARAPKKPFESSGGDTSKTSAAAPGGGTPGLGFARRQVHCEFRGLAATRSGMAAADDAFGKNRAPREAQTALI